MLPFIGRNRELQKLNSIKNKKLSSIVVARGRRRIGKSRLITEFAKDSLFLKFTGLAPEKGVTAQDQRTEFARQLSAATQQPLADSTDWANLFDALAKETKQKHIVIMLDEISWMAQGDATFLPKLKNTWDDNFSKESKIVLVLCSSVSLWIDENVLSSTSLFGRVAEKITLSELSLSESMKLLASTGYQGSSLEKFMLLMLTGGVPWYLELISPQKTAIQNIFTLCFEQDGILIDEYERIFNDLFSKRAVIYSKIVASLTDGYLSASEINKKIAYGRSGTVSYYIKDLITAGFLDKHHSWSFQTGKQKQRAIYRLKDNYLRFYLKYIKPNIERIQAGEFGFDETFFNSRIFSIAGFQFENLVLNNRKLIFQALGLSLSEIVNVNPYRQSANKKHKGCQIDLLIQTRFNSLFVCEIKFSRQAVATEVIDDVKEKIKRLATPKQLTCIPVLIHINGVSDPVIDSDYFYKIIDFSEQLG